jgi:cellulose synthase operon protein C
MMENSADDGYRGTSVEFEQELKRLSELLASAHLDPDPARKDWAKQEAALDTVWRSAHQGVPGAFHAVIGEVADAEQAARIRVATADVLGDAAGLLFAAGRGNHALMVLQRGQEIAAEGDARRLLDEGMQRSDAFTALMRAWWLLRRGKAGASHKLAKSLCETATGAIAESAQHVLRTPIPIKGPPALFTLNGCGVRIYGKRDHRDDGTYATTRYATLVFVPIFPVDAYRVAPAPDGESWYFLGKERLGPMAKAWRWAALAVVLLLVGWNLASSHYDSPEYRMNEAIAAARAMEDADAGAAIAEYERILTSFADASPDELSPVVAAIVRLSAADVPSPVRPTDLAEVERVVFRFMSLPPVAQMPELAAPLVERLETWARELGEADQEALLARLDVLAHAIPLATSEAKQRIEANQLALQRTLAEFLIVDWPIEAIRQYVMLGDNPADLASVAELMESLGESPSVWLELQPEVELWARYVDGNPAFEEIRETVLTWTSSAVAYAETPDRQALFEARDPEALAAALEAQPGDQELAALLAEVKLGAGDAAGAVEILEGLGRPGRLVSSAQVTLARAYVDAEREAEADSLLERVLSSRLPAFRGARRAFTTRVDALERQLLERAERGDIPEPWSSRFDAAADHEMPQIFGEWVQTAISNDTELARLRDRYTALADVVPIAIELGSLKLRRSENAEGEERDALLAGAERAFLAIAAEGSGTPDFHLGLGQVYYRLGRDEEGESELGTLLAAGEPMVLLAVAHTYRDLGKTGRAREVARDVYGGDAETPIKRQAAKLMSVLAETRAETEQWLQRSDPNDTFVRLSLLEVEASKHYDQGEFEAADAKFAEAAAAWAEQARESGAAANNAAVAMLGRYPCSGEIARIREARKFLEDARRLNPDDALVSGNLAGAFEHEAQIGLLDRWFRTAAIRPRSGEADVLLSALLDGPLAEATREHMRADATLRRALDTYEQYRTLAPASVSAYKDGVRAGQLLDERRLGKIVARLESGSVDFEDARRQLDAYAAGEHDARIREDLESSIERYRRFRGQAEQKGHAPTIAALWLLEGVRLDELARLTVEIEQAQGAVRAIEQAIELWPEIGARRDLAGAQMGEVILSIRAGDEGLGQTIDEVWRRSGRTGVLLAALDHPALAKALRGHPAFGLVVGNLEQAPPESGGPYDWLVAEIAGNEALAQRTTTYLHEPIGGLGLRLQRALDVTGNSAKVAERMSL